MRAHNLNKFHPVVPTSLEYETNYKNIPVQFLERNIPEGRGMIKWAPFATMPEQFRDVDEQIKSQSYETMPSLTDEQIIEINMKLHHYASFPSACKIFYYEDHVIYDYDCVITKLDEYNKNVDVYLCNRKMNKTLEFSSIVNII